VLLVNGVCTLANVVIANPTQVDLVSRAIFFHGVTMIVVTQAKEWFLSQLVLSEHVFPCSYKGFQMFTPTSE